MIRRWVGLSVLEAQKKFRRLKRFCQMVCKRAQAAASMLVFEFACMTGRPLMN
jgi:hypothetical protein